MIFYCQKNSLVSVRVADLSLYKKFGAAIWACGFFSSSVCFIMSIDDLTHQWRNMTLTSDEEEVADFSNVQPMHDKEALKYCVVGKVCTRKLINLEGFRSAMKNIWKVHKNTIIDCIGENLFIIRFNSITEKKRILNNGPWFFEKAILLLESPNMVDQPKDMKFQYATFWVHICGLPIICMNRTFIMEIGSRIGELIEVDNNASGDYWGKFAIISVWSRNDQVSKLRISEDEFDSELQMPCRGHAK